MDLTPIARMSASLCLARDHRVDGPPGAIISRSCSSNARFQAANRLFSSRARLARPSFVLMVSPVLAPARVAAPHRNILFGVVPIERGSAAPGGPRAGGAVVGVRAPGPAGGQSGAIWPR